MVREARLPEKVSLLRRKLGQKAKQEPRFRFYALYDRIYREDVLRAAWDQVRRNKGAPGIDGVRIEKIYATIDVEEGFFREIGEALKKKAYKRAAVRGGYKRKGNGKRRQLGIPQVGSRGGK